MNSPPASTSTPAYSRPRSPGRRQLRRSMVGGRVVFVRADTEAAPRARIPADVDQPDKIVYGLTARQLAIVAVAVAIGYGIVKGLAGVVPQPVVIAVLIP